MTRRARLPAPQSPAFRILRRSSSEADWACRLARTISRHQGPRAGGCLHHRVRGAGAPRARGVPPTVRL
jgi:hypothetical protein